MDAQHLSAFPNLRVLVARGSQIGDRFLQRVGELRELESLDLAQTKVSDAGLAHLAKLTKLGNHDLLLLGSDASFEGVRHLFVDLQSRSITEALNAVCHIDKGRELLVSYDGVEFRDSELAALKSMPWLSDVYLDSRHITDAGIPHLAALPALKRLQLVRTAITDDGLGQLGQLKQLTKLNLKGSRISDKGISRLAGLSSLESLEITDCSVTDAAAQDLGQLPILKELFVGGTKLTAAGIARLQSINPSLRVIGVRNDRF
jgi:Leucine-rich repeat (LRR) protein